MTTDLHLLDEGTVLRFTIKEGSAALDVSSATVLTLKLKRKDKTIQEHDMVFTTDGTDGKVEYVTLTGDIPAGNKGKWQAQVYLEMPGGKWHTSKVDVEVDDNVDS